MNILYIIPHFQFPIVEGTQRQCWELAKILSKKNKVSIIHFSKTYYKKKGISISSFDQFKLRDEYDVIHFFSPTLKILYKTKGIKSKKRIMQCLDGEVGGILGLFPNVIINLFKIDEVLLFSEKQIKRIKKVHLIYPLKQNFEKIKKKSKNPSILFMHFFCHHKGFFDTIKAFNIIKNEIEDIRLNAISPPDKTRIKIPFIKNIHIKHKIVNRMKELSSNWIYIYPPQKAKSTLAIPLSLFESIQCGTPFISTRVGAIPEYFSDDFLVNPKNPTALAEKIEDILTNYSLYKKKFKDVMKKKWTNDQIIKKIERIYSE